MCLRHGRAWHGTARGFMRGEADFNDKRGCACPQPSGSVSASMVRNEFLNYQFINFKNF